MLLASTPVSAMVSHLDDVTVLRSNGDPATRGVAPLDPSVDYIVREDIGGGVLAPSLTLPEQDALVGEDTAPGGQIEIFAGSEYAGFVPAGPTDPFATVVPTQISGRLPSAYVDLRSLNGNDWFETGSGFDNSFGVSNLANQWFNDFIDEYELDDALATLPPAVAAVAEQTLFEDFRDGGGFARLSDPNVAFVNENVPGDILVGFSGSLDLTPLVEDLLEGLEGDFLLPPGTLTGLLPDDPIQFSEVGHLKLNDTERFVYSFEAEPSGQVSQDFTESFDGLYEIRIPRGTFGVIPEPVTATLGLIGLSAIGLAGTRRRR